MRTGMSSKSSKAIERIDAALFHNERSLDKARSNVVRGFLVAALEELGVPEQEVYQWEERHHERHSG